MVWSGIDLEASQAKNGLSEKGLSKKQTLVTVNQNFVMEKLNQSWYTLMQKADFLQKLRGLFSRQFRDCETIGDNSCQFEAILISARHYYFWIVQHGIITVCPKVDESQDEFDRVGHKS